MIQTFITHKGTNDLILFFAGWGMDTQPFAELKHIGCDCCICYDYTHLDFDTTPLLDYKNIEVYAWSFGVWAASFVLQNSNLPIRRAVAINGTTYGIDREKGISPEIFQATLNNLDEANLNKFYRRMCYGSDMLNLFHHSLRRIGSHRSCDCHECPPAFSLGRGHHRNTRSHIPQREPNKCLARRYCHTRNRRRSLSSFPSYYSAEQARQTSHTKMFRKGRRHLRGGRPHSKPHSLPVK